MKFKLALFLVLCCIGNPAKADHHNMVFARFLEGEWTYEIPGLADTGTVNWTIAAKGKALIGRFTSTDGSEAVEIGAWRSDTRTMVATGYGSEGNYWHLEFDKVSAEKIEGRNHGVLPDGRTYDGTFVGKKVDEDHYQWDFIGKTGEGEELRLTGRYARKRE